MILHDPTKLKNGDVLHCRRNSLMSKIIRFFIGGNISHTALVLILHDLVFIVDSQSDGTRIRSFDEWNEKYKYDVVITRKKPRELEVLLLRSIRPYLNSSYGYIDLVRHAIHARFGVWLGAKREDKHLVCSEFVMRIYGAKDAYKMSPRDAYQWCLEQGHELIPKSQ